MECHMQQIICGVTRHTWTQLHTFALLRAQAAGRRAVGTPFYRPRGEVVHDSILLNKQKTKSYWEQLMMAAASPATPPASPAAPTQLPSLEQAGSELSEQEYFDARSTVSPSEPAEPSEDADDAVDGELQVGVKIVETVVKRLESVVERDIRLQREREEQVAREREAALGSAAALATSTPCSALDLLRDDGFVSIPTTDEGNFSEYGSEEKELSIDGSNSRVMSPEVGALPHHHHQRTQSMDSTSSGHSSGSGSGSGSSGFNGRRRVTVKPLAEPEDLDTPTFIRPSNETPIEREIRLSREREVELAREKALRLSVANGVEPVMNGHAALNGHAEVTESRETVRNATNRIQQEISRANEREQELKHSKESPAQRFSTPEFPDRVKLKKAVSTSHLSLLIGEPITPPAGNNVASPTQTTPTSRAATKSVGSPVGSAPRAVLGRSVSTSSSTTTPTIGLGSPRTPTSAVGGTLRRFAPNPSQKGLMQRFLASRGKVSSSNLMSNGTSPVALMSPSSSSPAPRDASPAHHQVLVPLSAAVTAKMTAMAESTPSYEREETSPAPVRRGYTSAEDKIQEELKEMRRREEELRLQRARTFARSQPNLLSLLDDVDSTALNESLPVIDKLPAMATLRSALSNPNLLDDETQPNGMESLTDKSLQKSVGVRKKNALIAEWENRIQQHIEH